jgi:hypothetical protein
MVGSLATSAATVSSMYAWGPGYCGVRPGARRGGGTDPEWTEAGRQLSYWQLNVSPSNRTVARRDEALVSQRSQLLATGPDHRLTAPY